MDHAKRQKELGHTGMDRNRFKATSVIRWCSTCVTSPLSAVSFVDCLHALSLTTSNYEGRIHNISFAAGPNAALPRYKSPTIRTLSILTSQNRAVLT